MSTPSSTSTPLPDAPVPFGTQVTQYGMRWPNGTVTWEMYNAGSSSRNIYFKHLAQSDGDGNLSRMNFKTLVEARADKAMIDRDEYRAKHQLVRRTVVVSVTAAEDVPPTAPVVESPAAPVVESPATRWEL